MKTPPSYLIALGLLVTAPWMTEAATVFTDDFSNGSTLNAASVPGGTPTASRTSYDIASTKNATACSIAPNWLSVKLNASTTAGLVEAQALFATNGFALSAVGNYIECTIVFTNTGGTLLAGGNASHIWVGLFNSGGIAPAAGGLANAGLTGTAGSAFAVGNCANWQGYVSRISAPGGTSQFYPRPQQNGAGTTSANQDLVGNNVGGGAFNNPTASTLLSAATPAFTLAPGGQYTLLLRITLTDTSLISITNSLFAGAGTGGTLVFSQAVTNVTPLISSFDGLAFGPRNSGTSFNPTMDVSLIKIEGESTIVTNAPSITSQPSPVSVPLGSACAFTVSASGFGMTYQWRRDNTNLVNGGNIAGATSGTLVISPVGAGDVASGGNGYSVVITGTGGYTTNSTIVPLSLRTAANLTWSGTSDVWDLAGTPSWLNGGPAVFNFGDNVTFDDTGSANLTVNLSNNFLSAASVTVNSAFDYVISGSGSIAGPGALSYIGAGHLTINNANSYSGGTLISNETAFLVLNNYNGLGSGPVRLAKEGGQMQIHPAGGATLGIQGNVIVADNFAITYDASSSFGVVLLGNLAGTGGKTLNILYNNAGSGQSRVRLYGTSTVYDANLNLSDSRTVWAPYQASGSQTYNGVISGNGSFFQRGAGTTYLNGANTYSGGTTPTAGAIGFGIDSVGAVSGPIGTGPLFLSPELPNLTGSATVLAWGGARTIANPIQYPSANNLTLIVGGTNNLTCSGPVSLNGDDGTGSINRIFQVNNTGLTTLSGVISDGGLTNGLIKTGTGTLALSSTETYSGPTAVSNGTLRVTGQLPAGAVTVATNATLAGTGTILGPVTVLPGGSIAPGASVGTLTINNNLNLGGNLAIEVNKSSAPTSDNIVVSGTLAATGAGTLTVTNLGPALAPNDSFTIFNKPVASANLITVTGMGAVWTNKLGVDGTIAVVSVLPTTPTNLTCTLSGGAVTVSWPANYTGWALQAQTNPPGTGITTNWVLVGTSTTTNQMVVPVNPANGSVFFRLVYP